MEIDFKSQQRVCLSWVVRALKTSNSKLVLLGMEPHSLKRVDPNEY